MCLSKVVNIVITHPKRTQGLVALAGLRTLGSEKGRPAGAYPAASGQLATELDYRSIIP